MKHLDLESLLMLLQEAGKAILKQYDKPGSVTLKEDLSPLTEADRISNQILVDGLKRIHPDIAILSEEGEQFPYHVRKDWDNFFLIDPLDGTKGFLRRDGEFAVNLALIHQGRAVMGLIHEPLTGITCVAESGNGAYKIGERTVRLPIAGDSSSEVKVILSRDDSSSELQDLLSKISGAAVHRKSSSLKFCMLAEGSVDFYPRKRPSMEWDTAAGAIIVEEAGGFMYQDTGDPILYNRPNLLNPPFFAFNQFFCEKVPNWKELLFKESLKSK